MVQTRVLWKTYVWEKRKQTPKMVANWAHKKPYTRKKYFWRKSSKCIGLVQSLSGFDWTSWLEGKAEDCVGFMVQLKMLPNQRYKSWSKDGDRQSWAINFNLQPESKWGLGECAANVHVFLTLYFFKASSSHRQQLKWTHFTEHAL